MAVVELVEEVPSSRDDVPSSSDDVSSNADDVSSRILLEVAVYRCYASELLAHIAVHTHCCYCVACSKCAVLLKILDEVTTGELSFWFSTLLICD